MSLLDDVSIVVTPNGYKAGELYAVVPVPTEGADLVDNGDFATDSDWAKGTGWTISGGTANCDGTQTGTSSVYQDAGLTIGTRYKATVTISNYSAGNIRILMGGSTYGGWVGTDGETTFVGVQTYDQRIYVQADVNFIGSIDNVSVKEYTSADMDVTRETAATRVDEDGLVNYAEIIGDEEIDCGNFECASPLTDWTEYNINTTFNPLLFTNSGTNGKIYQTFTTTIDATYRVSINKLSGNWSVYASTTVYTGGSLGSLSGTESGSFIFTATTTTTYILNYLIGGVGTEGSISNVSVKEVTRDNVPRIDYTGGGCPHILAEPQRTNNLTASQDLTNSFWNIGTKIETVVASTVLSPDGTTFGFKVIPTTSTVTHYLDYDFGHLSMPSGVEVTYSVFAKPFGYTNFQLASSSGMYPRYQNFELTGDGVLGAGDVNGAKIEKIGDWYRCSITETTTSITTPRVLNIPLPSSGLGRNPTFAGNGTDGVLLWGAQMEEGTYPTSYIPNLSTTLGSTVTRNQDIFTRDGIGSLINDSEGTLYFEGSALENGSSSHRIISLSDGTSNNLIFIRVDSTASRFRGFARGGGGTYTVITVNSIPQTDNNKIALVWDATNFRIWINGSEGATATINDLPVGMNALNLTDPTGTADPFFGKVKQLQVYNTALTDEQLLQLTGELGTDFYESYAEMASALTYTIQ